MDADFSLEIKERAYMIGGYVAVFKAERCAKESGQT